MSAISVEKMGTIDVGRQGENLARTIEFDVSSLLAKWPGAKITLLVKRKGDPEPYFAEAKVEGHILKWPITEVETAVAGDGKIEIQAILGEVIEKSVTATFRVSASLSGSASEELPEVRPSWVDEVLAAAGSGGGSGGAGEGAFIVTATRDEEGRLYADKTQDEIRAAVAAGELCFLVDDEGQVYSYEGDVYNGTLRETCPTFARPAGYVSSERITFHRRQVTSSKNVTGMSSTLPLPTEPNMQFVSNEYGYPTWVKRSGDSAVAPSVVKTVIVPETGLVADEDGYYITTPMSGTLREGIPAKIMYNGVEFESPVISMMQNGVAGFLMGNTDQGGIPGGNPDAPFYLVLANIPGTTNDGNPIYGFLIAYDSPSDGVTISVTQESAAHLQLVSDAAGNAVWEARTHYKTTTSGEVYFLQNAVPSDSEDMEGTMMHAFIAPLAAELSEGNMYDVEYNGVKYACPGVLIQDEGGLNAILLGNAAASGFEGGNPDAPFVVMCLSPESQALMGGVTVVVLSLDDAETLVLSIKGFATVTTYEKLEEGYLPDNVRNAGRQITLSIDEDGNVTSDVDFETAWAMTDAQLAAAITVVKEGGYSCSASITRETLYSGARVLQIAFAMIYDPSDNLTTHRIVHIHWYALGNLAYFNNASQRSAWSDSLPYGGTAGGGNEFPVWNGGQWIAYSADQTIEALGIGQTLTITATLDSTNGLAIKDISKSFTDTLWKANSRAIIQLRLFISDGSGTYIWLPMTRHSQSEIVFYGAVDEGMGFKVTYTSSGMTVKALGD